jgi:hypothetical protein
MTSATAPIARPATAAVPTAHSPSRSGPAAARGAAEETAAGGSHRADSVLAVPVVASAATVNVPVHER